MELESFSQEYISISGDLGKKKPPDEAGRLQSSGRFTCKVPRDSEDCVAMHLSSRYTFPRR